MIRLEKFDKADYPHLIFWVDSEEMLMQFAGPVFNFPLTVEQLDKSLHDANRFAFKVLEISTNSIIGYAEIYLTADSAFLGRLLIGEKKYRGKGLGGQIVTQLLNYSIINLEQTRSELNVFNWNIAAIKCYEKAGFMMNPGKISSRRIKDQTWVVLNMTLDKDKWKTQ